MDFIELLKVIFLGIVEGLTEWLPISSTGHMILVDEFIKLNVSDEFMQLFLVVIQLGAILAVVVLYFKRLWPFHIDDEIVMPERGKRQSTVSRIKDYGLYLWYKFCDEDKFQLWFKILVACIPAMIVGLLFDSFIETYFNNWYVVSAMLIIYGILFIVIENRQKNLRPRINKISKINYRIAFAIGLFQVLAVIPGTSRSGATIIGGMLIGTSRLVATEFTFYLAIPVMLGASLLKIVKFGFSFTAVELQILGVGMLVAFIVSIIAIRFLLNYIKRNDFKVFGYYRIILGVIVFAYFGITMLFA
ncbi:Undecaprenyl-diphosphatase [Clostridiales bacterium CHKCI006]|nr:Undecaprenyl-diphosphatase [Clostridiales bacterium CHKCI006]